MVPFFFCRDILWLSHFSGSLSGFVSAHARNKKKKNQSKLSTLARIRANTKERVHTSSSSQRSIIWRKWAATTGWWLGSCPGTRDLSEMWGSECYQMRVVPPSPPPSHQWPASQCYGRKVSTLFCGSFQNILSASLALWYISLLTASFKDLF